MVLHGCRQFVVLTVKLSFFTNATHIVYVITYYTVIRTICDKSKLIWLKPSLYGLYTLGYTRVTMVKTKHYINVNCSELLKITLSSNCFLKLKNMKMKSLVIVN
jgi:hypothetical protein